MLARSDRRVAELTSLIDAPQNLVSYHLGELRKAGLVTSRRSSADGRDVYYRAELVRCSELLGDAGGMLHPSLRLAPSPPVPRARTRTRVLFLCTGNSARSQMAEALLVHRSGGRIDARSAGSHPKPLHPLAVQVMAERGIDIAGRSSTSLERFLRMRFDRVVSLCDKVWEVCPDFPSAAATAHWSTPDPTAPGAGDHETFVRLADDLDARVALLLAELSAAPDGRTPHGP